MNKDIALFALDPKCGGGIFSETRMLYKFHEKWGFHPVIVFIPDSLERWKEIPIVPGKVHEFKYDDMNCVALPRWFTTGAIPQIIISSILSYHLLRKFDALISIGGYPGVAFPLSLLKVKFIIRFATLIKEEMMGENAPATFRRNIRLGILQLLERKVIRTGKKLISIGSYGKKQILENFPEAGRKVESILFPIDQKQYFFQGSRNITQSRIVILCSGRINDPRKNIQLLLRSFSLLCKSFPNLTLVLIGEDPKEQLRNCTHDLSISENVHFLGYLPSEELVQQYQESDIFVLPSFQEGLGIVMLEAMSCGLPVVATRCGGPESVIVNGVNGYLVANNDIDELTEAIRNLILSPHLRRKIGKAASDWVKTNCDVRILEKKFLTAFSEVFPDVYGSIGN